MFLPFHFLLVNHLVDSSSHFDCEPEIRDSEDKKIKFWIWFDKVLLRPNPILQSHQ